MHTAGNTGNHHTLSFPQPQAERKPVDSKAREQFCGAGSAWVQAFPETATSQFHPHFEFLYTCQEAPLSFPQEGGLLEAFQMLYPLTQVGGSMWDGQLLYHPHYPLTT